MAGSSLGIGKPIDPDICHVRLIYIYIYIYIYILYYSPKIKSGHILQLKILNKIISKHRLKF